MLKSMNLHKKKLEKLIISPKKIGYVRLSLLLINKKTPRLIASILQYLLFNLQMEETENTISTLNVVDDVQESDARAGIARGLKIKKISQ